MPPNSHRPVSRQSHLCLGEKDRKGEWRWREKRGQQSVVSFCLTDVAIFSIHLTPFSSYECLYIDWQTRQNPHLQSDPVSPLHLLYLHTLHDVGLENVKWNLFVRACVLRCVYACHCAYTSEAWGWFKVPFRCVRTAFTNTLVMQKMLSSSASLFVYEMSPVTIKHVEVSPSLCHSPSLPSPQIEQIVPSSFCSCSLPSLLSLLKRFNLKGLTDRNKCTKTVIYSIMNC